MLRRIIPYVAPAEEWWVPSIPAWLGIAFSYQGLKALGLPQASLDSFPEEFRQGMAARAEILRDIGDNAPANWEYPFGTSDAHVALAIYSRDDSSLESVLEQARQSQRDLPQIAVVYRMKFSELPDGRNPFGFKDGLHNPHVEGSGANPPPGYEPTVKAGEFIMGYYDELGETATSPEPEVLRRNGTFIALRKFHTRVASFRKFLREQAESPEEEELIAAKMVGRWRSGAPLVLAPEHDDPTLGADPNRNNDFGYSDDMEGLKCPFSAHIRRLNPRDALKKDLVAVNLHHVLRRATNYGPPLPEGALEDDGEQRGGVFLLIGAHIKRQFEFLQSQWITDGDFIGHGREQDPILGNSQGDGTFTIPKRPIRRRLHGLPQFVVVRGGEYCFLPGLRALKWLAALDEKGQGS
jgi:Dyp-type peroxidase family